MAKNFASIAFSPAVKKMQENLGSRKSYARMEQAVYIDGITENEMAFISQRDSFYMASFGENKFPYIQHRGGPPGFLKVLDSKRLGFIDFKGNMQYISAGNIVTNNNFALIMVVYPARARLKIYAKAEIIELKDNQDLLHLLDLTGYKFKPERMMIFNIEAYDWNCPQHITPRYTLAEIETAFELQQQNIVKLEAEIKSLKQQLKNLNV